MWDTWIAISMAFVGSLMGIATLLPFIRSERWWIRVWDFPRLQIAFICGIVIFTWLFVWTPQSIWQTAILIAVAAAMVHHMVRIFPYTALARKEAAAATEAPDPERTVTLLVTNVLMENRRSDALLSIVDREDPDVVLAVETDSWWQEQLDPLAQSRPHTVANPLDNCYGMLMYSRFPLSNTVVREMTRKHVPSIRTMLSLPGGEEVLFYGMHPPPPFPGIADESTPRDAELVLVAREVKERTEPVIVAGDLNDVAWSNTTSMFQRISRLLDPRTGRGLYNTFHARNWLTRWPLDHVFFSDDFGLVALKRLPAIGSDHFPLLVRLTLSGRREQHNEPESADRDTNEMAERKLEEEAKSANTIPKDEEHGGS